MYSTFLKAFSQVIRAIFIKIFKHSFFYLIWYFFEISLIYLFLLYTYKFTNAFGFCFNFIFALSIFYFFFPGYHFLIMQLLWLEIFCKPIIRSKSSTFLFLIQTIVFFYLYIQTQVRNFFLNFYYSFTYYLNDM